jgi:phage regulator Rha-like protein
VPVEVIERRIYLIRGQKVMLDSHLAELYGVETFNLNKAVKRNWERFPADFMFQLTREEFVSLRFQIGMSKVAGRGGRRTPPYAFTEQGVAMLSSLLHSKRAVQVNIVIMRAFVKLRDLLSTQTQMLQKLDRLESKYQPHDVQIKAIFDAIRRLIEVPVKVQRRIGFRPPSEKPSPQGR